MHVDGEVAVSERDWNVSQKLMRNRFSCVAELSQQRFHVRLVWLQRSFVSVRQHRVRLSSVLVRRSQVFLSLSRSPLYGQTVRCGSANQPHSAFLLSGVGSWVVSMYLHGLRGWRHWLTDFSWSAPDLWMTWDHLRGKVFAVGQPTRPLSLPSCWGR